MYKFYLIFRNFGRQMKRQNISAFSASTAFFLFLSFVPMLVILFSVVKYTPLTQDMVIDFISKVTPGKIDPMIMLMIKEVYDASFGILSIAAITTIWTASRGVLALIRGLNSVNEVVEERNYFALRAMAAFYMVIMLAVMILSLLLMVFGNLLIDFILIHVPKMEILFSFFSPFRFLFSWVILTLVFAIIYTYVPNKKMKFREQLTGAAFSAIAWGVFSFAFSIYVDHTNAFSVYGSLSLIVIMMLWLYFCIYIFMVGAHINRYIKPIYLYFSTKKGLTK